MKYTLLCAALCGFLAAAAAPASASSAAFADTPLCAARTVDGITFEGSAELAGRKLVLSGAGMRKILFIKVYAAGLYLTAPETDVRAILNDAEPRRVRIGLLRDVSGGDFVEALMDGLDANLTAEARKAIEGEIQTLASLMEKIGDVKEGDLVDFDYTPEAGTTISVNGTPAGASIPGKALYDAVLAIWMGEKPIDASLKAGLLGGK